MEKQPEIIRDKACMRAWSRRLRFEEGKEKRSLALVPTMGFLHKGHLSLIREARAYADLTVVSIYVNPGQFSPSEDLASYPSDLRGDLRKLSEVGGVDAVFCPGNLYDYGSSDGVVNEGVFAAPTVPAEEAKASSCLEDGGSGHESWIRVESLERGLCGKSRPVFFRGVATVVAKLFNIVEPDVAIFGKKDYQQWRLICRMVRDLDFAVKIIGSEIVREVDGLAMSSRNVRLLHGERDKALSIYKALSEAKSAALNGQSTCQEIKDLVVQTVSKAGGKIDYAEIVEQESLTPVDQINRPVVICIAAWFGNVRLIDNIEINA
uniref:Pantoate--beta-alanine ligase n=1 Tax=Ananas comosus var. bracteatus TaxID=296719 RepID=A0A6V7PVH4_ANACO|nr:unnamed protein product [Ananas comosus var. bracteatus]